MKTKEVIDHLDLTFHPEYQEDYDNSGYLLGDDQTEYRGALVALDLTPAVVDEAIHHNLNLIVTHHPFIFNGLKRITTRNETGRIVATLIRHNISVYAAHTNLDNLPDGVNGILAARLGLITNQCHILRPLDTNPNLGAGMIGPLAQPTTANNFLSRCKTILGLPTIRCSAHNPNHPIQRVALCGGSGTFLIPDAIHHHADIFLTADIKYHDFQRAEDRLIIADIGHYESEQFAKEIISCAISEKFSTFACRIAESQQGIVRYI